MERVTYAVKLAILAQLRRENHIGPESAAREECTGPEAARREELAKCPSWRGGQDRRAE